MAYLISRTTDRDLLCWNIRIALVSLNPTQRHCFGSFCIHVLTNDGLPNAHVTTPLYFLSSRLLDSFCVKQSSCREQKGSPSKQSSCGDGPAETAATSESSSPPRMLSRTTLRMDSTNSTRYGADANPLFTCMCLSRSNPETLSHNFSSASARSG